MPALLLLFIDGLDCRHVQFLMQGAGNEFSCLELTSYIGYSPGLHTTIWTSVTQDIHGVFMEYELLVNCPIKNEELDYIFSPVIWSSEAMIRYMFSKALRTLREPRPTIPLKLRQYLVQAPVSDRDPITFNSLAARLRKKKVVTYTLFEVLSEAHIPWIYLFDSDGSMFKNALPKSTLASYDVVIVFTGSVDASGHKWGPFSPKTINLLNAIRKWVKFHSRYFRHVAIISDHGMAPNIGAINILKIMKYGGFTYGKDYMALIDGTMTRFIVFNENLEQFLSSNLTRTSIIDKESLKSFKIPQYYDIICVAPEGYEFNPNFWHPPYIPLSVKGFHGYMPNVSSMKAPFIMNRHLSHNGSLIDIAPTLVKLLDLDIPNGWNGRSLE